MKDILNRYSDELRIDRFITDYFAIIPKEWFGFDFLLRHRQNRNFWLIDLVFYTYENQSLLLVVGYTKITC